MAVLAASGFKTMEQGDCFMSISLKTAFTDENDEEWFGQDLHDCKAFDPFSPPLLSQIYIRNKCVHNTVTALAASARRPFVFSAAARKKTILLPEK
jgi:hypothetical protein